MAGSRKHFSYSFMPTRLRSRTLVDTNVLRQLYSGVCILLLCAGPIEGCSAVLAVRTVDTAAVAFRAWFVCAQKKSKYKNKTKNFVVVSSELMIQLALSKKSTSPAVIHVHLAVGTPQCHDLD